MSSSARRAVRPRIHLCLCTQHDGPTSDGARGVKARRLVSTANAPREHNPWGRTGMSVGMSAVNGEPSCLTYIRLCGMYRRVSRVSRPMKLITLRIDEDEKARLDQLAERGNITLSRALREGAALYLQDRLAHAHRSRGYETTFHGIRRDGAGRPLNKKSAPTKLERRRLESLRTALSERALGEIRSAWQQGSSPAVILAALGQWLSLVGQVYVSNGDQAGWDWFLRDYCGYPDPSASDEVRRAIRGGLLRPSELDVASLLDRLDAGLRRLLTDVEEQELVRRAVLPTWHVMSEAL